jgi:hypothetical protein
MRRKTKKYTGTQSENRRRCPICLHPYSGSCANCGHNHDGDKKEMKDNYDSEKNLRLFRTAGDIDA